MSIQLKNSFALETIFSDLAAVMDGLPLAVALLSPDRRLFSLNRAMESLTGYTRMETRGLPCVQILRCSCCRLACPVARTGLNEKSAPLDGDIINRDRRLIPVRVTVTPVHDREGQLAGFLETLEDRRRIEQTTPPAAAANGLSHLIGRSPRMEALLENMPFIAQTDSAVLITGETGTGKDILAEAIHYASKRAQGPFIKVNCGALPETLLESELFGYHRGVFTGANENRPGRVQLAHNGTLLLTEIGDLSLPLQVKLLSFLDDNFVYPPGGGKAIHSDVRIISATHHDLDGMIGAGKLRADLLFRLNVIRLHLPPLRERGADRRLLLDHFLQIFAARMGKNIQGFTAEALARLEAYDYRGNVRELRNIVEYACTLGRGQQIESGDLPAYLHESPVPRRTTMGAQLPPAPYENGSATDIESQERHRILGALAKSGGRRGQAARILGWGRTTLWRKIRRLGLEEKVTGP